jgi:hypothetical protein
LTPNARSRPKVASLTVVEVFVILAGLRDKAVTSVRHCEERSDEAIHAEAKEEWIASLRSQ